VAFPFDSLDRQPTDFFMLSFAPLASLGRHLSAAEKGQRVLVTVPDGAATEQLTRIVAEAYGIQEDFVRQNPAV